jgi:hypothetical protein
MFIRSYTYRLQALTDNTVQERSEAMTELLIVSGECHNPSISDRQSAIFVEATSQMETYCISEH